MTCHMSEIHNAIHMAPMGLNGGFPHCVFVCGEGSVKYERSWGIEESLEQFQCLMRQHLGFAMGF